MFVLIVPSVWVNRHRFKKAPKMLTSTNPFGSCMSRQAGSSGIIQKNYIIDFFYLYSYCFRKAQL